MKLAMYIHVSNGFTFTGRFLYLNVPFCTFAGISGEFSLAMVRILERCSRENAENERA